VSMREKLRELSAEFRAIRDGFGRPVPTAEHCANRLDAILAEPAQAGEAVAWCDPSNPLNNEAFAWPGTAREARHSMPLYAAPTADKAWPDDVGESRFFIDHSMVHDRKTGKHVGDNAADLLALLQRLEQERDAWRMTANAYAASQRVATNESLTCTCPSGDGSLRWPCPKHPPSEIDRAITDLVTYAGGLCGGHYEPRTEIEGRIGGIILDHCRKIRAALTADKAWPDDAAQSFLDWNRAQPEPPVRIGNEYAVFQQAAALQQPASGEGND
jgi:hypothetical protein